MVPCGPCPFPLGEAGGTRRSFQQAATHAPIANKDGGIVLLEAGNRRCPACNTMTYKNRCHCGAHTKPVFKCQKCGREGEETECPSCHVDMACSSTCTVNVKEEYAQAISRLGIREARSGLLRDEGDDLPGKGDRDDVTRGYSGPSNKLFASTAPVQVRYDRPPTHPFQA